MDRLPATRSTLQVITGTYTGTGIAQTIPTVGFQPVFLFIKGESQHPVFRTKEFTGDNTAYFTNNVANLANAITGLTSNGFTIGTDASVNSNGVAYFYFAIAGAAGQTYFDTGRYTGTGGDDRNLAGLNFTPEFVTLKKDGTSAGQGRLPDNAGDSAFTWGAGNASNKIQSIITNGFQLGTDTAVNANAAIYYYLALRSLAKVIKVGSYTGTGANNSPFAGMGFQPNILFIKNITTGNAGAMKTSDMSGQNAYGISNGAAATTIIKSLDADGFTLGTSSAVNTLNDVYNYVAIKSGNYSDPIVRTVASSRTVAS